MVASYDAQRGCKKLDSFFSSNKEKTENKKKEIVEN